MSHYANRMVGNVARHRVAGELLKGAPRASQKFEKPQIQLTSMLMEMFVQNYLMDKLDDPKLTPPFHRELWELCCSQNRKVAIAAPRAHAKSTAVTLAYVMASALLRQKDFILIVSDTWAQSIEFLGDLKAEIMENEKIIKDFSTKKLIKDTQDDIIVQLEDGYKFRIVARGSEQKVRGLKWNNKRPNLIVGDDLEGDEQVESKPRRDKFFKWLMKALLPCGSDDCIFRFVGTILHFDSALERLMKDPTWTSRRYSAHASYADFTRILWPEKFSVERLRGIRDEYIAQGEADSYSCEYLNNPIAEGDAFFQRTNLLEMTEAQRRDILDGKLRLTYYAGWDFAVSQEQKRDYTVGSVWGVDQEGWNYKVDIRRGRWDTLEIVDEMFNVEKAYSPQTHFVEKGTIEKSILPFLNVEMKNRKRYIDLTALTSTTQKEVRAKPLQGITKQKHLIVDKELPEWPEMEEEYVRFPKGQHDDIVDSDSIIARGMQDIIPPDTDEEIYEDEMRKIVSADDGRSRVTGY